MVKASPRKDVPLAPPPRNFAARGIAALIAPIVRPAFRRRAPAAAQLLADWDSLAGPEFSTRAAPVKFAGGTLTLACNGPAAMELQYQGAALISRLNLGVGQQMVERLRFIQLSPTASVAVHKLSAQASAKPPPNLPDGPLGEALAKLYEGIARRG
ncbi:MAG: DUF721 domain-containing protein [Acidocella sp.]|nr:DUF721 domain-containing protein [Acidocella sp.]